MLAPKHTGAMLISVAEQFLTAMRERDFTKIWDDLITPESVTFLSSSLFPLQAYQENRIDDFLVAVHEASGISRASDLLSLAFQLDTEGVRSGLFEGIASGLEGMGWDTFKHDQAYAFLDGPSAVLIAETSGMPLILPFVQIAAGTYRVDMTALVLFSEVLTAPILYQIGTRAEALSYKDAAVGYFELTASLSDVYRRLERLIWNHPATGILITDERKEHIKAQQRYVLLAEQRRDILLEGPQVTPLPIDTGKFLVQAFKGYADIAKMAVTQADIDKLFALDDAALRKAIAALLLGVDPVVAQREAEKPHTPAEIADMELPVEVGGTMYYLCLPFKSALEIKKPKVPVEYAYQIDRPFLEFHNCILVFITARPCSQPLHNLIKKKRDRFGWPIEVIEHKQLAALLKVNGLLK